MLLPWAQGVNASNPAGAGETCKRLDMKRLRGRMWTKPRRREEGMVDSTTTVEPNSIGSAQNTCLGLAHMIDGEVQKLGV